jgi:hypothetical protein
VLIQNNDKVSYFGPTWKTIRGIYATEGLVGLYRGAIPRTINLLPITVTVLAMTQSKIIQAAG